MSSDDCLEDKMVDDQNCSVLCNVPRLCIEHIRVLQSEQGPVVLGSGFQLCVCVFLLTNVDIFFYVFCVFLVITSFVISNSVVDCLERLVFQMTCYMSNELHLTCL